jgi:serine protease
MKKTITNHDIGNLAIAWFNPKMICLLIFTCLGTSSFVSAQSQQYYWAGDTKYYFDVDSTELLIEVNALDSRQALTLKTDADVKFSRTKKNTKTVQFGVNANARRDFINRNAIRAGQFVSYPMIRVTGTNGRAFVTDEITVKFDIEPDIRSFSSRHGIVLVDKLPYGAYLFKVLDRTKTVQVANRIKETEHVIWSNPNFVQVVKFLQADPLYNSQYHLNNTGQTGGTNNVDINAPEAWSITTGCNIRVAVIDNGVEAHPDLDPRITAGFTPGSNGGGVPMGNASHGQQCAGLIAASHNTVGGRGIAPNALIVPVNLDGASSVADIGTAINWAWRPDGGNADVLSNSWETSVASADIVNEIYNARLYGRGGRGAVVVFASGNSNGQFSGVTFPGNLNGVVTVGAVDKSGNIWNYSSRGPEMDLVAPSGNVNDNGDIVTTDRVGTVGVNTASGVAGNYSTTFGGTSAACPQVAGVVALILSVNPTLTEIDVRNILNYTATDMGTAGFDNTYGYGRVNALAAVQAARVGITGPGTLCSTSNITLTNIPLGSAGTWTVWPASLVSTSSGTFTSLTGSATISITPAAGNPSGSVTLTVNTTTACGTPISVTKAFWVGIPQLDGTFNGQLLAFSWVTPSDPNNDYIIYNDLCTSVMGTTDMIVGGSSGGSWSKMASNPSSLGWSTSGKNISFYFYANNQSARFRFTASNSCGTTTKDYYFRSIACTPGGGGGCDQYTVSPNPAKSVVNIVVPNIPPPCDSNVSSLAESSVVSDRKNNTTIQSVRLIDVVDGTEKFAQKVSGAKTFDVDVSKLKKGIYLLFVSDGKSTERHRIVVE